MHKHRVRYHLVRIDQTRRMYWHKTQVEKLSVKRLPKVRTLPPKFITTKETTEILGISRSTLQRHYQKGRLKALHVRFVIPGIGPRRRTYFLKSDVLNLAARLNAIRRRAEELDRLMNSTTLEE